MPGKKKSEVIARSGISRRSVLLAATGSALAAATTPQLAQTAEPAEAMDPDILDVIIVGAGLAGLTAARDLSRAGCDSFAVLEGNDRVGGRTYNHKLKNGRYSEAGGQWIGPGQTAIYDLCRELNIGVHENYLKGKSVYMARDGSLYEEDANGGFSWSPEMRKIIDELNELSLDVPSAAPWTAPRAEELDRISVAEYLADKDLNAMDTLSFDLGLRLTDTTHHQNVSLLYALSRINYAGTYEKLEGFTGGAQEHRIENGSQYISEAMAAHLGDKVHLSTPVRKITAWDQPVVRIHTDRGEFSARQVIFAMSPGMCDQLNFEPALPEKRRELQRLWPTYAPGRKTAHVYSKPFWRERGYNGWFFTIGGQVMWAYDNSPHDAAIGVINAFIYPSMPSDPEVLGPMLAKMYAKAFGDEALDPLEFHDQDWGEEPFCMGCVSPHPKGFLTSGLMETLRAPIGNIVWSGTETAEIWQTYMDGAVRSGHRAALEALNALSRVNRQGGQQV